MLHRKVSVRDPDQIFIVVRNAGSALMTPGYAAFFDYRQNTTAKNDGWSVRFPEDYAAGDGMHAGLFAGVVAERAIRPQGFGLVQIWGHTDKIFVTGSNVGASMWTTLTQRSPTDADLSSRLIWRPYGTIIDTTATGMFALFVPPSANVLSALGLCVIPWDGVYPWDVANDTYGTTYGTLTFTSSGTTRGFVRCF